MAIPIKKFGQYVLLEVHDEQGLLVFKTDSLKIDFDVRHIKGWSVGKVVLTNLNPEDIRAISQSDADGKNGNYVTIRTSLHDSPLSLVMDRMYISNAMEEVKVPDSEFSMYCYSNLKKLFLDKQIDLVVKGPTLRKLTDLMIRETKFKGEIEYKHFPPLMLDHVPPQRQCIKSGSLTSELEVMSHKIGRASCRERV